MDGYKIFIMPFDKKRKLDRNERCGNCQKYLRYEKGRLKTVSCASEAEDLTILFQKEIKPLDTLCETCRNEALKLKYETQKSEASSSHIQDEVDFPSQSKNIQQEPEQIEEQMSPLSNISLTSDSTPQSSQSVDDPSYVLRNREGPEIEFVEMAFIRVVNTHKYCCICRAQPETLVVVPLQARIQAL